MAQEETRQTMAAQVADGESKTQRIDVSAIKLPMVLNRRKAETTKRQYGHALIVAGSRGKMGAAVLAAKACMRMGVGLLTVHVPACGVDIMQVAVPEAMVDADGGDEYVKDVPRNLNRYNVVAIGPGLGTERRTARMVRKLIEEVRREGKRHMIMLVVDADALNIIAADRKHLLPLLPPSTIVTPHEREYERLFDKAAVDAMAARYKLIIVRKAHCTEIATPKGRIYVNHTGNAGMATAGSGDVLTGIIAGLVAMHLMPEDAAVLGVYLHGKSGDMAVQKQSQSSLIASDIIENLKYATI